MSAFALAAIWTAALLIGTAVIALVLVKRAAGRGATTSELPPPPEARPAAGSPTATAAHGNGHGNGHAAASPDLLLLRLSHDLRGPLGSVVTLCQLLTEGDAGPLSMKQHQYIDVIRRSGQNVLALVDDILDLAAIESGRSDMDIALFDLPGMTRDVIDHEEPSAREKGIPLQANLPRGALVVRGDEPRLRHILERMVEHVLLATDHGYVEVAVDSAGAQAMLRVRNTPDGLSEAARRALTRETDLLDGFAQDRDDREVDTRVGEDGSTSLPLVMAARLARRAGTALRVRSGPDDGLALELALPRAAEGDAAVPRVDRPSRPAAGSRILLVDDDAAERLHVTARLEEVGYLVTPAASGSDALSILRDASFDAVVLDLVMPGLSGLEVLRAARTDRRLRDLPFVVLSALYMTQSERAVLGPAVASVVRKGEATADDLLRALARALAPSAEAHAQHGDRHA
jgi:signal transduction histidine kinase/CheY-like chemotaxis protein